ncbi:MAG: glutaredoxin family protein [Actinomycetota bacterium]
MSIPLALRGSKQMTDVILYTKPGCHLCDDARVVLDRVRVDLPFGLLEVDINSDEELFSAYFDRIPVLRIDGEDIFELFVAESDLRNHLKSL